MWCALRVAAHIKEVKIFEQGHGLKLAWGVWHFFSKGQYISWMTFYLDEQLKELEEMIMTEKCLGTETG